MQKPLNSPPTISVLPPPVGLSLKPVEWEILTSDKLDEKLKEGPWVYMALTPRAYENLSTNIAEKQRFIREAVYQLRYYIDAYSKILQTKMPDTLNPIEGDPANDPQ